MDERLEKAIEFSNFMVTLNNQKRLLKEKYLEDLIYFYDGCQFTVTKELINFCYTMLSSEQDEIVLVDDNNIPLQIDNIQEFYNEILNTYFTSSNNYFVEYEKLKKNRSVTDLVGLEID